jgi:hypothetical protein
MYSILNINSIELKQLAKQQLPTIKANILAAPNILQKMNEAKHDW